MRFDWKVYAKDRYVDSGTIQADTQKIAMGLVLAGQAEKDRDPDTSYRVTVGDSVTSSFGDEFLRSAEACSWTAEPEMDGGGFTYPSLKDVGITLKDAMESTKGVVADLVETAGEALDKLTEIVEDEGWSLQMPVGAAVTGTICVSNLRDVGKPEDVVLKRVPVVGGEWVPVVKAPSEWISPPSGGSTAEQVRIASGELDARIASYPSGRMSVRAPNFQQLPATEPGTKSRDPITKSKNMGRTVTELHTEVLLDCMNCGNQAYVSIPGIPSGSKVHKVSGVECGKCGTTHSIEVE